MRSRLALVDDKISAELDRTGHVYGIDSPQWRDALVAVEELVARIIEAYEADESPSA